jgi:WD40 repeat protein
MYSLSNCSCRSWRGWWLSAITVLLLILASGSACEADETKPLSTLKGPEDQISTIALAEDGKTLAALHWGVDRPFLVSVWDIATGKQRTTLKVAKGSTLLAFSPDGKTVAVGVGDEFTLWDVASGKEGVTLKAPKGPDFLTWLCSLAYMPKSDLLAAGYSDSTVVFWNVAKSKIEVTVQKPDPMAGYGATYALVFTNEGKTLVTAGAATRAWDLVKNKELTEFKGHKYAVRCAAITPDGKTLSTGTQPQEFGKPGELKLWDANTGKELADLKGHTSEILCVAISPDGKILASAGGNVLGGQVRLWDIAKAKEFVSIKAHKHAITGLLFTPDGKTLITASADETINLWSVAQMLKP